MNRVIGTSRFLTAFVDPLPRLTVCLLAALPLMAVCEICLAQTTWTAGTSDWFTPTNWTLGVPNVASGTAFDAIIANGGAAQLSAVGGSVRRLRVGLAGGPGSLLVDGGTLGVTENLHLNEGNAGPASVTVINGATVTSPSTIVGFSQRCQYQLSDFRRRNDLQRCDAVHCRKFGGGNRVADGGVRRGAYQPNRLSRQLGWFAWRGSGPQSWFEVVEHWTVCCGQWRRRYADH